MKQHVNLVAKDLLFHGEGIPWRPASLPLIVVLGFGAILGWYLWELRSERVLDVQIQYLTTDRARLQKEMQVLTNEISAATRLTSPEPSVLVQQLEAVRSLLKTRILWSEVLRHVSFLVPEGVYLTRVESSQSKATDASSPSRAREIRMVGFAQSLTKITYLLAELEASEYFTDIGLVYAQKSSEPSGSRVKFELVGSVRKKG